MCVCVSVCTPNTTMQGIVGPSDHDNHVHVSLFKLTIGGLFISSDVPTIGLLHLPIITHLYPVLESASISAMV